MIWQVFSLYPQIFDSFLQTSLIARAIDQKILEFQIINWRNFGVGNYKQVDDRPFGGGSGMVLQIEPIIRALVLYDSLSDFGKKKLEMLENLEKITQSSPENSIKNLEEKSDLETKLEEKLNLNLQNTLKKNTSKLVENSNSISNFSNINLQNNSILSSDDLDKKSDNSEEKLVKSESQIQSNSNNSENKRQNGVENKVQKSTLQNSTEIQQFSDLETLKTQQKEQKKLILPNILPNNSEFYDWIENQKIEKLGKKKNPEIAQNRQDVEQNRQDVEQNKTQNKTQNSVNSDSKNLDLQKLEMEKVEMEIKNWENCETENLKKPKNIEKKIKKATILLTPRGFPLTQKTCQWLADFDQISLICGRFDGFDYRLNEIIDLEISIGDFVTNGGETPSMCLIEAVSRLVPDFITKKTSYLHDSFGLQNNDYLEQKEFVIGKKKLDEFELEYQKLWEIKKQIEQKIST